MQRIPIRRGVALLALAVVTACDAPPTASRPAEKPEDLAALVEALGFRSDLVQDFGDYVLVEGDIHITKAQLRAAQLPAAVPGRRLQYRTTNLVSSTKVSQITVNLSGLASQTGWQTAARDAITHWSGITDSNVEITEVTGAADITVTTTCTSYNVAASASFPSGGNPGNVIYVNTCFGYSTSHAQKVHNMVHEFGHTLGFRHSNYTQMGESAGTVGAVHIYGTPTSGNATGSVMNGGTALNSWSGFATSDLTAVRSIYPLPGVSWYSVTNSGGYPLVSWGAVSGATSYTVELITYNTLNGQYQSRYFTFLASTTGTSYLDTEHPWTGSYECTSYYDDLYGGTPGHWYEYAIFVNYPNGRSQEARHYAPIAQPYCGF